MPPNRQFPAVTPGAPTGKPNGAALLTLDRLCRTSSGFLPRASKWYIPEITWLILFDFFMTCILGEKHSAILFDQFAIELESRTLCTFLGKQIKRKVLKNQSSRHVGKYEGSRFYAEGELDLKINSKPEIYPIEGRGKKPAVRICAGGAGKLASLPQFIKTSVTIPLHAMTWRG
jgi:hypothetical protein